MGSTLHWCLLFAACLIISWRGAEAWRTPVVLVPGLGGSVLEEKLNRTSVPAWYCTKESDWQVVWLSLTAASRPECLLDDLTVTYNATDKRYYNQSGVEVRAYQFGNLTGVEALDPAFPRVSGTYAKLIDGLKEAGYTEGKDLFGAPFDFRLAADGLEQVGFFNAFQTLIEQAVRQNGHQPAALVTHSMGSLVSLYFLNKQPLDWRQKNVGLFIAASAPWEGAVTALKGSISGDNFDVSFIPHDLLRPLQSTLPSGPWLFPAPDIWGDQVLVSTRSGDNYTANDALKLLQDLNLTQQAAVYPFVHGLTYPLPKLEGMKVHCLYGTGVKTETGFEYDVDHFNGSQDIPAPKKTRVGNGDGTANLQSLEACSRLGHDVELQSFEKASHLGLLKDDRVVKVILDILGQSHSGAQSLSYRLKALRSWACQWLPSLGAGETGWQPRMLLTQRRDAVTLSHPSSKQEISTVKFAQLDVT